MELFKKSNMIYWDLKSTERELNEKLATLKLEPAKTKAIARAEEKAIKIKNNFKKLETMKALSGCTIEISWIKSSTWGYNPHARLYIWNGETSEIIEKTASGCGYDKLSSAISYCFNDSEIIKATLLKKVRKLNALKKEGYNLYGLDKYFSFNYGVGVNCFKNIFELLGFKFQHEEGKNFNFIRIENRTK